MANGILARELGSGLRRNLTMTIATVITVAVSLSLFGAAVLVGRQVDEMKDYWYDRVEISIFLCGDVSSPTACPTGAVSEAQRQEILAELTNLSPLVETVYYESQEEAFARFQEQFAGSSIAAQATVNDMPESYRVKLSDPTQYQVVASAFIGRPGVESVNDQRETLSSLFSILGTLQMIALVVSIAMLVVMVLLIFNTIRLSSFTRRRETGIKRMVGASAVSIQLPFILEAAVAAAAGGILAFGILSLGYKVLVTDVLMNTVTVTQYIGYDQVLLVAPLAAAVGVVTAALAALLTLSWYTRA